MYIKKVKEFMTIFKQPIIDKPSIMPEDRNKLRIALIFEELKEYAEASGLEHYFCELSNNALNDNGFSTILDNTEFDYQQRGLVNLTEQFDALLDLQYVLSGAVLENGFGDIFDEGFAEVHRSNMSKACNTEDEALDTTAHYSPIPCNFNTDKYPIIVYRLPDMKVLKSVNYSPANLQPIIDGIKS